MTFADLAATATKNKEFAKEKKEIVGEEEDGGEGDENVDVEAAPDVHFTPIVKLEAVETKTLEEEEEEVFKMRAKMFRFEKDTNEWKERGTGEVRLLKNPVSHKVRLVMRRDQTLKVCANHLVTSEIVLRPNVGSDRSWVYNVLADVSDGEAKAELFAIRFANSENAKLFKQKFEECQSPSSSSSSSNGANEKSSKEDKKVEEEKPEAAKESTVDQTDTVQKSLEKVNLTDAPKTE